MFGLPLYLISVIQQCIQQNVTCHSAQSMFSVHDSMDCHGGGTASSIHHDFFPTRAGPTQDVSTRSNQLEDKCLVPVDLEQQLDEASVSDFLHTLQMNFWAAAMMSQCACFLRRESIIPRRSE